MHGQLLLAAEMGSKPVNEPRQTLHSIEMLRFPTVKGSTRESDDRAEVHEELLISFWFCIGVNLQHVLSQTLGFCLRAKDSC